MRVLVTGASGFVGRRFVDLAPDDHEIVAVRRHSGGPVEGAAATIEADLATAGFERELPTDVDVVVHLAQSRRDRDFPEGGDDMVAVNVAAAERLLSHARSAGARFLLPSTATVYARAHEPLAEDAPLDCSSLYAATKRGAELLAGAYAENVPCRIVRIFTPYGPGQRNRLIADLAERVRNGDPVQVQGRRGLLLSPIHVDDVAAGLHALLDVDHTGRGPDLVNLAGPEALGIREIATALGEASGVEPLFEQSGSEDPGGLVADCSRLSALLPGFSPRPFAAGATDLVGAGP